MFSIEMDSSKMEFTFGHTSNGTNSYLPHHVYTRSSLQKYSDNATENARPSKSPIFASFPFPYF